MDASNNQNAQYVRVEDNSEFPIYILPAVKSVFLTMAKVEVIETKSSTDRESPEGDLTSFMVLKGERLIMMYLTYKTNGAFFFASTMLEKAADKLSIAEVHDCVAELSNMIAGQIKSQLAKMGKHYVLTAPMVISGQAHCVCHKSKVLNVLKTFKYENLEFDLKLIYL